jgi:hypothetical protein
MIGAKQAKIGGRTSLILGAGSFLLLIVLLLRVLFVQQNIEGADRPFVRTIVIVLVGLIAGGIITCTYLWLLYRPSGRLIASLIKSPGPFLVLRVHRTTTTSEALSEATGSPPQKLSPLLVLAARDRGIDVLDPADNGNVRWHFPWSRVNAMEVGYADGTSNRPVVSCAFESSQGDVAYVNFLIGTGRWPRIAVADVEEATVVVDRLHAIQASAGG